MKMRWSLVNWCNDPRFFARKEIVWGNILTVDSWMKMRWSLVKWCNICKDGEKLANHILIHCDKIWKILDIIVNNFWFGSGIPRFNLRDQGRKKKQLDSWLWFIYFDVFGANAIKGYWKIKNCHTKGWATLFPFPRGVVPTLFQIFWRLFSVANPTLV